MPELTLENLVRAWEMLVDQYLSAIADLNVKHFPAYHPAEKKIFRKLLIALIRPPENTPLSVTSVLSSYCFRQVSEIESRADQHQSIDFHELHIRALKTANALGRILPRFLLTQEFDFEDLREVHAHIADRMGPPLITPDTPAVGQAQPEEHPTSPAPPSDMLLAECRNARPTPAPDARQPPAPEKISSAYVLVTRKKGKT